MQENRERKKTFAIVGYAFFAFHTGQAVGREMSETEFYAKEDEI